MYARDASHPDPILEEKLQHLFNLRRDTVRINLSEDPDQRSAYFTLLKRLDDPHTALPKTIHVAGTNGKGSCIAFMRATLEAGGYSVHTYTSPHLYRFNERIVLNGAPIDDALLKEHLDEILSHCDGLPLTFFEVTTALAFLLFSRMPADILLLETGLGGRLDCTNVILSPLATLITHIGYDHTEFLGDTLTKIATEKAGIMKASAPCILAQQDNKEIVPIIKNHAQALGIDLILAQPHKLNTSPNLCGDHQKDNAAAAITCLNTLKDFDLMPEIIEQGLKSVYWPGRLEHIEHTALKPNQELWFDGGHNISAAHILEKQCKYWQEKDTKPLIIILGMMQHKDPVAFTQHLSPYADAFYTLSLPDGQSHSADRLQSLLLDSLPKASIFAVPDQTDIIEWVLSDVSDKHPGAIRILVTGSLYARSLL